MARKADPALIERIERLELKPRSCESLLAALLKHVAHRDDYLARLAVECGEYASRLESAEGPGLWLRLSSGDAVLMAGSKEQFADEAQRTIDAFESLDMTKRGRRRGDVALYDAYESAVSVLTREFGELRRTGAPRRRYQFLLRNFWESWENGPAPLRTGRKMPDALIDTVMTARTAGAGALAFVAAAAGQSAQIDSFARNLRLRRTRRRGT